MVVVTVFFNVHVCAVRYLPLTYIVCGLLSPLFTISLSYSKKKTLSRAVATLGLIYGGAQLCLAGSVQGIVIPSVHGYYDILGLLRLLALEDVGIVIPEHTPISTRTGTLMKSTLARIHSAGYVHGG
jgi:hypothetical protein